MTLYSSWVKTGSIPTFLLDSNFSSSATFSAKLSSGEWKALQDPCTFRGIDNVWPSNSQHFPNLLLRSTTRIHSLPSTDSMDLLQHRHSAHLQHFDRQELWMEFDALLPPLLSHGGKSSPLCWSLRAFHSYPHVDSLLLNCSNVDR